MMSRSFAILFVCASALSACDVSREKIVEPAAALFVKPDTVENARVSVRPSLSANLSKTDFGRAVNAAVMNSPETRSSSALARSAEANVGAQKSAYYPDVGLSASTTGKSNETGAALRLTQLLYDGGETSHLVRASKADAKRAHTEQASQMSTLAFRAVETAINLERERKAVAIMNTSERTLRGIRDGISEKVEAGTTSQTQLLTADSRLALLTTEKINRSVALKRAESAYVAVFDTPAPATLYSIPRAPKLTTQHIDTIVENSPKLSVLRHKETVAEHQLNALRAGRFRLNAIVENDLGIRSGGDPKTTARVDLDVPFSTNGQRKARLRSAEEQLESSKAQKENLTRTLKQSLTDAFAEAGTRSERLAAARHAVNVSQKARNAAQDQFDIGNGSLVELLDAVRDVNDAKIALNDVEAETRLADYVILAITGDILPMIGVTPPGESYVLPSRAN